MSISTGDPAPDFELSTLGADGPELFKLSDNLGAANTLILFVPMAFTGVCTAELCDVSGGLGGYADLGAQVVAISGDNPFAQAAWAEKEGIDVKLLSDYEHGAARAYGVAYEAFLPDKNLPMGGVPKRSAFVVDKGGTVRYAEVLESPGDLPDFGAIKAVLGELG